jgi:hypothetical protein
MFLSFNLLIKAALLVGGLWWCKEIFQRLRSDIDELKTTRDRTKRNVIIFFWVLTLVIIFFIVRFIVQLLSVILKAPW